MLSLRYSPAVVTRNLELTNISRRPTSFVVCGLKGPRPRYPRVWKPNKRIGTISKSKKLVDCIKGLSNVKEEVYGALDSLIAWELEFPLITVKKALKTLENEEEWKRIIQVTKWMLSKGQGKTKGSYYTLLNALAEDGRLEEAEDLWTKIFRENLENLPREFFGKMISIYYNRGMHQKMFEIFADMEELGVKPNSSIVEMLGNVFQELGMEDKYDKLMKKYPPATWEYRYFRGKRVRTRSKNPNGADGRVNAKLLQTESQNDIEKEVSKADTSLPQFLHQNMVDDEVSVRLPQLVHQIVADEEVNADLPQLIHQNAADEVTFTGLSQSTHQNAVGEADDNFKQSV